MKIANSDAFEAWDAKRAQLVELEKLYAAAFALYAQDKAPFPGDLMEDVYELRERTKLLFTAAVDEVRNRGRNK